jgi:hypothetical protein
MSSSENRARFPTVAAFIDELRAQGLSPKVMWAREGDHEVGQRPKYAEVFDVPRGYGMPATRGKHAAR